jgi:cell division protein ZapA (FtsZ GTPase activity inhibitor)
MTDKSYAVSVSVNGIAYEAPCAPGEAVRVRDVAQRLDERVRALAAELTDRRQAELLLLAALMLEDERETARNEVRFLRAELERQRAGAGQDGKSSHADQILAQRLLSAAERIAAITEKLDAA